MRTVYAVQLLKKSEWCTLNFAGEFEDVSEAIERCQERRQSWPEDQWRIIQRTITEAEVFP